jgi:hypothetical protein
VGWAALEAAGSEAAAAGSDSAAAAAGWEAAGWARAAWVKAGSAALVEVAAERGSVAVEEASATESAADWDSAVGAG